MELDDTALAARHRSVLEDCPPERQESAREAMQAMVDKVLPCVSHRECIEKQARHVETNAQRVIRYHRLQRWGKACPKAFAETEYSRIRFKQKAEVLAHIADGQSALLKGETGTGKTRLIWIAAKAPHMAGKTVHIWSHIGLSKHAAAEAMKGANYLNTFLFKSGSCDIFVLDDFGKGRFVGADGQSLQGEELVFEILDRRLSHGKQTIISTNDSRETLMARMTSDKGAPLIRRLLELCRVFSHEA